MPFTLTLLLCVAMGCGTVLTVASWAFGHFDNVNRRMENRKLGTHPEHGY